MFLGAAAMFAIGDMYSRSGNSMIAALAKANNVPVLVCCETYKFTDKVQLHTADSNLHSEYGRGCLSVVRWSCMGQVVYLWLDGQV